MNKKERTIKACRELAAKYREPEGKVFFEEEYCALCKIPCDPLCRGCPLSNGKYYSPGCTEFNTNIEAQYAFEESSPHIYYGSEPIPSHIIPKIQEAFNARAAFFDKIIPILEKIPAERFTKRGWKYFDELDRSW